MAAVRLLMADLSAFAASPTAVVLGSPASWAAAVDAASPPPAAGAAADGGWLAARMLASCCSSVPAFGCTFLPGYV